MSISANSTLNEDEVRILKRHEQYGIEDIYLSSDKSIYHPWVNNVWLKPLRFDVRTGTWAVILWAKGPGGLGRHRHRGPVTAYTLEGSWRYEEYDWIASEGDFVQENPGVIHTLKSDTGCKVLFFVSASMEFYEEDDTLINTMDVFAFLDLYINYCEEQGVEINKDLIF